MNILVHPKEVERKEASRKERRTLSYIYYECIKTEGMNKPLTKENYV